MEPLKVRLGAHLEVQGPDYPDWCEEFKALHTAMHPEYRKAMKLGKSTDGVPEQIMFWEEVEGCLRFPREPLPEGVEYEDLRVAPVLPRVRSSFSPREAQQGHAIDAAVEALRTTGGAVLVMPTGSGKTIMGVEVGIRMNTPTLILTHMDRLSDQFHSAIEKLLPGEVVGRVQADSCTYGPRFTTASVQTLVSSSRTWDESFLNRFGLIICDEVHRHSASQWRRAVCLFPAKYRLGLTADEVRADGLECVFLNNIGPVCFRGKNENHREADVHMIDTPTRIPFKQYTSWKCECGGRISLNAEAMSEARALARKEGRDPKEVDDIFVCSLCGDEAEPGYNAGTLLKLLSKDEGRNKYLANLIVRAYKSGRQVIAMSHYTEHLEDIALLVRQGGIPDADLGLYFGTSTSKKRKAALDAAAKKRVILATYKKAGEGFDEPRLDTLIPLTPVARILQPCGRVLRPYAGKPTPVIVDPWDVNIPELEGWGYARRRYYEKEGWL